MGEGDLHASPASDPTTWLIGIGVIALVTVLMAWDHLWGNEPGAREPFPVDLGVFLVAMVISLVCAGLVFLVLVPRTRVDLRRAPRRALWLSGLAVPLALVAGWLGFPLIMAGGSWPAAESRSGSWRRLHRPAAD